MKKSVLFFCIGVLAAGLFLARPAKAADWRFPLGISYTSGFGDIVDLYENNLKAKGYLVDTVEGVPIGISFQPYVQFDSGLRLGGGFGPPMMLITSNDTDFFDLPVNLNIGYTLFPSANISPYVRGGMMYHLSSGDYVVGTSPGIFGSIGIEFARQKPVGFGIEIGLDKSKIEFDKTTTTTSYSSYYYGSTTTKSSAVKEIEPISLMVSIYVIF